jgi:spore maturation protein CgeB
LVYTVGKEILTYEDAKDCLSKIRWLLDNPDEADKIREAGRCRTLAEHTWERRFDTIFSLAGLIDDTR